MYLQRKVYVGANFEHREITGTVELFVGKEKRPLQVNFNRINTITENVGY